MERTCTRKIDKGSREDKKDGKESRGKKIKRRGTTDENAMAEKFGKQGARFEYSRREMIRNIIEDEEDPWYEEGGG